MSAAEAAAIQSHWNANVKPKLQEIGDTLFVEYFAAHPEDLSHFKKFSSCSGPAYQAQTLAVMEYLDKVVAGLGTNGGDLMKAKAVDHDPRGIGKPEFGRMFAFLPGFMEKHGGPGAAWKAGGEKLLAAMY